MKKIRKATDRDFEDIYSIYMDKSVNPYMSFPVITKEEFQEIFDDSLADLMVYEQDKEILVISAVEKTKYKKSHVVYIGKFAVHPNFHGQGIAAEFFKELIAYLKAEGIKRIELNVMSSNLKAVKFYKRMGFEKEGVMKNRIQKDGGFIDDYLMALHI